MPPRHLQHPDADSILTTINRHLLKLQHQFRALATQAPQPLALEDAPDLWEAWADDVAQIRADLQTLLPPRAVGPDTPAKSRRLPGRPFTGTPPGLPRTLDDER